MQEIIDKLDNLLELGVHYFSTSETTEVSYKPSPEKWSKKEILGHLIDSGVNNLQRFTEIQFESKPYVIRKYNQNALVTANDYQNADAKELLSFWLAINQRIKNVIILQTEETLNYKIVLGKDKTADSRFLMTDYVAHMEHHLKQIMV